MRILVVQESDWIEKGPHQSHHLMERLSKRGHEVRVIDYEILWRERENKEIVSKRGVFRNVHKVVDEGGVTVIRPSIIKLPVLDYLSLVYTHRKEIKRQIEEFKPDVFVGFGILNANIAIRLAKKRGIPFVYYIIDELHRLVPQKYFQWLAKYVESKNMKNADKVISINEWLREYTIQMGAEREKTEVIRAGVELEHFNPADRDAIRERHGIKDEDVVLFFMGWLYSFSGLKEVAMELAGASEKHRNIKLLILGKGDLWDTLQDIKREFGLDSRIIIAGWQPYEEVPKYIMASDICLLPAYKNDVMKNIVPIKMYEYMAAGKPVIATSLPGIKKEFGNDNGVIYVDRPEDVLEKAVELIENGGIEKEGRKARKFVEKYSWDNIVDEVERVLEEVIWD